MYVTIEREVIGLIGPNGPKDDLFNLISGYLHLTAAI
jgi:ABC-type branched-subunit amino acid transport system ATPase component